MSRVYSIAQRTTTHNGLFAGIACAIALTLTAGPALSQPTLNRVEINGRVIEAPVRYDVLESCRRADMQLQRELESTWHRDPSYGNVDVHFAVADGRVQAVTARGVSPQVDREVRRAVRQLDCADASAGTSIYRLRMAIVDPFAPAATALAGARDADAPYTVTLLSPRR